MIGRRRARVVGGTALLALASTGVLVGPAQADDGPDQREGRDRAISVEKFAKRVKVGEVFDHLDELQDIAEENDGTRASGTPGYDESVDYVVEELRDAGYDPVVQSFDFPYFQAISSSFSQVAPTATSYVEGTDYALAEYSASGDAQAAIVPVDLALDPPRASTSGCEPSDFLAADGASLVSGRIALVQRGSCPFGQKVENAAAAGAVGTVIMNQGNEDPNDDRFGVLTPTLGAPASIPAVSVSFDTGVAFASTQGLVVRIAAETVSEVRTTANVIAETRRGDDGTVVMAGAHLDSVPEGPGINDNGSGSAALLEIAVELAEQRVAHQNTVRFAWWGAEEANLLGSTYYVENLSDVDRERIALYLNFDMIASPNYTFGIYDGDGSGPVPPSAPVPPGSAQIEHLFESLYDQRGEPFQDTEFSGRSDYGPFIAAGIPAGGLFTGAEDLKTPDEAAVFGGLAGVALDPCYHQVCDDLEGEGLTEEQEALYEQLDDLSELEGNVNEHALEVNTAVIASAILSLARDASAVTGAAATP
jgi:Zn-dependent M28 family amino/carboxypeptidase